MRKLYFFILYLSLILSYMNTACSRKGENKIVMQWENSLLLPGCTGMLKNVGLAGAYSGIVEDKLLVLGGANFPDKYPWEGGVKTWCLLYIVMICTWISGLFMMISLTAH